MIYAHSNIRTPMASREITTSAAAAFRSSLKTSPERLTLAMAMGKIDKMGGFLGFWVEKSKIRAISGGFEAIIIYHIYHCHGEIGNFHELPGLDWTTCRDPSRFPSHGGWTNGKSKTSSALIRQVPWETSGIFWDFYGLLVSLVEFTW